MASRDGVNVESIVLGCKYAMPYSARASAGSIINISSLAAFKVDPDYTAYNTSKAAVAMLTKSVAIDCARQKIDVRCNSIHPAFIRTGIVAPFFARLAKKKPRANSRAAFPCAASANRTMSPMPCCILRPTKAATSRPPKWCSTAAPAPSSRAHTSPIPYTGDPAMSRQSSAAPEDPSRRPGQARGLRSATAARPELKDGEFLVRVLYLSMDPTNRVWMSDIPQYMPPVAIGEVMRALGLGRVVSLQIAALPKAIWCRACWLAGLRRDR
jgi:hypothetical protein